jgi:hypothetical protein
LLPGVVVADRLLAGCSTVPGVVPAAVEYAGWLLDTRSRFSTLRTPDTLSAISPATYFEYRS